MSRTFQGITLQHVVDMMGRALHPNPDARITLAHAQQGMRAAPGKAWTDMQKLTQNNGLYKFTQHDKVFTAIQRGAHTNTSTASAMYQTMLQHRPPDAASKRDLLTAYFGFTIAVEGKHVVMRGPLIIGQLMLNRLDWLAKANGASHGAAMITAPMQEFIYDLVRGVMSKNPNEPGPASHHMAQMLGVKPEHVADMYHTMTDIFRHVTTGIAFLNAADHRTVGGASGTTLTVGGASQSALTHFQSATDMHQVRAAFNRKEYKSLDSPGRAAVIKSATRPESRNSETVRQFLITFPLSHPASAPQDVDVQDPRTDRAVDTLAFLYGHLGPVTHVVCQSNGWTSLQSHGLAFGAGAVTGAAAMTFVPAAAQVAAYVTGAGAALHSTKKLTEQTRNTLVSVAEQGMAALHQAHSNEAKSNAVRMLIEQLGTTLGFQFDTIAQDAADALSEITDLKVANLGVYEAVDEVFSSHEMTGTDLYGQVMVALNDLVV